METNGGIEPRPIDGGASRPDDQDVTPLDTTAENAAAEDAVVAADPSCGAGSTEEESAADDDVIGAVEVDGECAEDGSEVEPPPPPTGLAKIRGAVNLSISPDRLKAAWRAHSLGRVALLAVCIYALVAASSYFFVLQPLGRGLHEVKEQKSILHDYVVIQQAGAAIGTFKDGLMTGDQRLTVMSEVRLMAEGSGVKIIGDPDLLPRRPVSGCFVEYPVRLRVRGTFHEMGEFLSLLESSPRFILVEEVEIRSEVDSRDRDSEATVLLALAAWEG